MAALPSSSIPGTARACASAGFRWAPAAGGARLRGLPRPDGTALCRRCGLVSGPLGRARPWYELDTVWARTGYGAFVDELWQPVARELGAREVDR